MPSQENSPTALGRAIFNLRHETGLTQADMAKIIGVRQQTIGSWEHGPNVPQTRFRETIDNALAWIVEMHPGVVLNEQEAEPLPEETDSAPSLESKRERMFGALIVRLENGPPLSEPEASILRDLAALPAIPVE
ncbi:MAG: hypothetical protein JWM81_966 [Candidatus Saccharibacteria bacterium]|nr:hypothetical protein [Candidatus Saccharibacteria bacterium]